MIHDWAWAAGLFEGEGCISIRNKYYPELTLKMTDEDAVRTFTSIVNGTLSGPYHPQEYKDKGWKAYWVCKVTGKKAWDVVLKLKPYLHKRRQQRILELLWEIMSRRAERKDIAWRPLFSK